MVSPEQTIPNSFFENFWGTEEIEDKSEECEFYLNFLEHNERLKAEILNYDFQEDHNKKYTVYNIKVVTDYFTYTIQRRFSLFEKLRNKLKYKHKELNLNSVNFPAKTLSFFFNNDIETIEKRKIMLNDFLQLLCAHWKDHQIIDFLEFLELNKRAELSFTNNGSFLLNSKKSTASQDVAKLLQFLDLLNQYPDDLSKTMKEMETFYMQQKPRMNRDVVKALIIGKVKSKGLIHFCGKYDPEVGSHLVCSVGLALLDLFLDHQMCPDADTFRGIFGSLNTKTIGLLNLQYHIDGKSQKQCKGHALKVLDIYLKFNPTIKPKDILDKADAQEEYVKWKAMQSNSSRAAEMFEVNSVMDNKMHELEHGDSLGASSLNSMQLNGGLEAAQMLDWEQIYNEGPIKVKQSKNSYLKIRIICPNKPKICSSLAKKGVDYLSLIKEQNKLKQKDYNCSIYYVKVNFSYSKFKQVVFLPERKQDIAFDDSIKIMERPSKDISIVLEGDQIIGNRFVTSEIKQKFSEKGNITKLKILIKNLDEPSRAIQKHILTEKDENGELLIVKNCKQFLKNVEEQSIEKK